jgi:hypothetical protein
VTVSTVLTTWTLAFQSSDPDPRHAAISALGEYAGGYDIDGLVAAYVDAIDAQLPDGLALARNGEVYGPYRWDGDPGQALRDAHEAVDFWALAEAHGVTSDDTTAAVTLASADHATWLADLLAAHGLPVPTAGATVGLTPNALTFLRGVDEDQDGVYDGEHVWIGGTEYEVRHLTRA